MATVREVYELLKKKQAAGEKIGMFAESLIETVENEQGNYVSIRSEKFKSNDKKYQYYW